jgi:hypothetical protein
MKELYFFVGGFIAGSTLMYVYGIKLVTKIETKIEELRKAL